MKDMEIQKNAVDTIQACLGEAPFIQVNRVREN